MNTQRKMPHAHITEYAAGTLPPAKHLMVACQREISKQATAEIEAQESIAAAHMLDMDAAALSGDFMSRVLSALPDRVDTAAHAPKSPVANDLLPKPLVDFMDGEEVNWKFLAPGMKSAMIWQGAGAERIYLLKVKGGMNMPEHTHVGEEWSLILDGSYHVGTEQYVRGDLHVEDEHCTHVPMIDPGVDCICLVFTEGGLKPTGLLPKMLMPFMGV